MNHQEILKKYHISAKKSLGQNFLVNDAILESIAEILPIEWENIIEIGPGYGALTEKLLARTPESLTLIELDPKMIAILESRLKDWDLSIPENTDFSIVHQDVLKYIPDFSSPHPQPLSQRERGDYSVIANIPYYITSPILFRFLFELDDKPDHMLILMQKEVGDKICKKKGNKNSYLSLAIEYACEEIEDILSVAKGNFIPPPKIESSVLWFKRRSTFDEIDAKWFLRIISAGFLAPRKKLLSNLSGKLNIDKSVLLDIFTKLGWLETIRAEEVALEGWRELIELLESSKL